MPDALAPDASAPRSDVRSWLVRRAPSLAALAALAIVLATERSSAPVGVFYDDGIYLDLARTLAAGDGYRHSALPGSPPGVHYPPLFPVWLALWSSLRSLLGPHDVVAWLKLGNALLAASAVGVWTLWGLRRLALHPAVAAAMAASAVLIVPARAVTSTLFSEPLSWLLTGVALLAIPPAEAWSQRRRALAVGVALVALLPLARSILLPFALALAWQLMRARQAPILPRFGLAALALIPALAWSVWVSRNAGAIPDAWSSSYGSYTSMWLTSWSSPGHLLALATHQLAGLGRVASAIWSTPGAVIALLCAALGAMRLSALDRWVGLGLGGYLLLVLVWPIEPDRFVWGMLPLLALLCAAGASTVVRGLVRRRFAALAALILVGLPLGACGRWTAAGYRQRGWIVPQEISARNAAPLVRWGRGLPPDAVVLTGNDPLFAMATGRRAAPALPPDLGEASGRQLLTPARRLERSACAAGSGWLAVGDPADQVGMALRELMSGASPSLRIIERVELEGRGAAWRFECMTDARKE